MFKVEADTTRNILRLTFVEVVGRTEARQCREKVEAAVTQLRPEFSVLTDLSGLEEMHYTCAHAIQEIMDICRKKGVGRVVRVIPDPTKDIGFNLMSLFHYGHEVPIQTFKTLPEALQALT